ncbi:thioredoxin domain-containing protein [Xanthobacter agilis]|jgi:hydrogenase-1 operon protein HyaE|uniref:Hydrogenase-1 operon protein HyaE n=1 Tax=Xanthobacter agilis TaxID=47492 RepID=A0ABU0L966_XANAG|nr:hydrogenase [Xanthobacter agilis]MDQ0503697.1 hydrogenase-1 operon protein HyaE [Xanthobacter agilis]
MSQDALHPLVRRLLTERAYAWLETAEEASGLDARDLFVLLPAHGKAHLESPDIAVVLPELVQALGGAERIGGAVAGPKAEASYREALNLALPAIVVLRGGVPLGAISRMRDWDEYLDRLGALLGAPSTVTH